MKQQLSDFSHLHISIRYKKREDRETTKPCSFGWYGSTQTWHTVWRNYMSVRDETINTLNRKYYRASSHSTQQDTKEKVCLHLIGCNWHWHQFMCHAFQMDSTTLWLTWPDLYCTLSLYSVYCTIPAIPSVQQLSHVTPLSLEIMFSLTILFTIKLFNSFMTLFI